MEYKGWDITYNPKPIGTRCCDYDAVHPDYDGADGGNGLLYTAGSVEHAKQLIDEHIADVTETDFGNIAEELCDKTPHIIDCRCCYHYSESKHRCDSIVTCYAGKKYRATIAVQIWMRY